MNFVLSKKIVRDFQQGFFWNLNNVGYRVFVGGKGTGKSTNIGGYESVMKILNDPWRNVMFVRLNDTDNNDSTVNYVSKAIKDVFGTPQNVDRYWWFRTQPNRIIYKKTGQMFLFKGFNHPDNMNGTESATGYISDVYIEEASQIKDMNDFLMLDQSIRAPDGYPLQITFMLNPWDINSWIYQVFCKDRLKEDVGFMEQHRFQSAYYPDFMSAGFTKKGLYIHRSSYLCNPFLNDTYRQTAIFTKERAPLLYATNFMGLWGNTSGQTYPEWQASKNVISYSKINDWHFGKYAIGIDTGYSNGEGSVRHDGRIKSATVCELCGLTADYGKIATLDEYYWTNCNKSSAEQKTSIQICEEIINWIIFMRKKYLSNPVIMKGMIPVFVDCADTASIDTLTAFAKRIGLLGIQFIPSTKISILNRVEYARTLMGFGDYVVFDTCPNLIREIEASRKGNKGEPRENLDDHAINADEYGWFPFTGNMRQWKDYKVH